MGRRAEHHDHELWPAQTWREDREGRLLPRTSVLIAGEDDLPHDVVRRCVHHDDVVVVGPLLRFADVVDEVDDRRPDLVLLCGITDDPRLHAALYELHGRTDTTRLALMIRLGDTTRCLAIGEQDPLTDELLLQLSGEAL